MRPPLTGESLSPACNKGQHSRCPLYFLFNAKPTQDLQYLRTNAAVIVHHRCSCCCHTTNPVPKPPLPDAPPFQLS